MSFFICYDISDDKRRLHLSKLLQRKGCKRIQKSVFTAIDFERTEMLYLKIQVNTLLNKRYTEGATLDDSVLYIPLDNDAVKNVVWEGNYTKWTDLWKKSREYFFNLKPCVSLFYKKNKRIKSKTCKPCYSFFEPLVFA
jgi:CRISPR-associated protein Cas2